jgi:hypothetical protein
MARSLQVIANEIKDDWKAQGKGFATAAPYRDAMHHLTLITDSYYQDSGKSIVNYFLANAGSWRGDVARRIKTELKGMVAGA